MIRSSPAPTARRSTTSPWPIDDLDAGITHVVRGEDHLSNTPKQMLVLEALGAPVPMYAHLPLLHGPDGKKLSKRHGAASVQELRDAGYLPEAVDNYIALLGAGFASDEEFFTLPSWPSASGWSGSPRTRRCSTSASCATSTGATSRAGHRRADRAPRAVHRPPGLRGAVEISAEKIQTLADFWPLVSFLFDGPVDDPGRV